MGCFVASMQRSGIEGDLWLDEQMPRFASLHRGYARHAEGWALERNDLALIDRCEREQRSRSLDATKWESVTFCLDEQITSIPLRSIAATPQEAYRWHVRQYTRRPAAVAHEFSRPPHLLAGLTIAAVDEIVRLKVARLTAGVDEIAQRGAAGLDRLGGLAFTSTPAARSASGETRFGGAVRVDAGAERGLLA